MRSYLIHAGLALLLASCTLAQGQAPLSVEDKVGDVPLAAEDRAELTAINARLIQPEAGEHCTAEEAEFVLLSLVLMAARMHAEEPGAPAWTAEQTARMDALARRWEALGGDPGTVSDACEAWISAG